MRLRGQDAALRFFWARHSFEARAQRLSCRSVDSYRARPASRKGAAKMGRTSPVIHRLNATASALSERITTSYMPASVT
jgi:hypothetical protein